MTLPLLLLLACSADGTKPDTAVDSGPIDRPLSFVIILTDDQRYDMLDPIPGIVERIFDPGLVFTNAVVNTPLCCPARASIVAGGFVANQTGVLRNEGFQGGMEAFDDRFSVGLQFQAAGYQTAYVGKYLNLYPEDSVYIPPGWSRFVFPMPEDDWYDYRVVVGSSGAMATVGEAFRSTQYSTDYLHDEAVAFIDGVGDAPFMLLLSELAPHDFAQPATEDDDAYAGAGWRGGAYDEEDVSDKPAHIRALPRIDEKTRDEYDHKYQNAMESLLAVDRSIVALIDGLEASGRLDDTVIIYTSDNGHLFGEHRLWSKGVPYIESVRVPLAVRLPGGVSGVEDGRLVSTSTDMMATVYDLAGIDAATGGQSFAALLRGESAPRQDALLLEGYATGRSPDYAAVLTEQYSYIEYVTGEGELYDHVADPTELENLHGDSALVDVQAELAAILEPMRGLVLHPGVVTSEVGGDVDIQLQHWGGEGELHFTADKALPPGLILAEDGRITGSPAEGSNFPINITVTDERVSPYHGGPQDFTRAIWFAIDAELPFMLQAPTVTRTGGRAQVQLHPSADVALEAWLGFDPSLDLNPRKLPVVGGRIDVEGLGKRPAWLRIDGMPEPVLVALQP